VEEAREFQQRPENVAMYGEDEIHYCRLCGFYHLSHPSWNKPHEIPAEKMKVN